MYLILNERFSSTWLPWDSNMKKGFKQTEVGLVPEDWEVCTLGEVIKFIGGSQPPQSVFVFSERLGYVRLIQIRDYKTEKYVTYIPKILARRFCTTSDIMIGRYGPPIFQILNGIEGAYNVALIKAVPDNLRVIKSFIWQFLRNEKLFNYIEKLSQRSSGQTGVDLIELRNYPIALPPLKEQQAIASALTDADAWIESLEKLLQKKRLIKQGAMQELLKPKEGWEEATLGNLCKILTKQTGFDYTTYIKPTLIQEPKPNYLPFIQNKDFQCKKVNFNTDYYIPIDTALMFPKILLDQKSLLISISGSVGNVGIYNSDKLSFIGGAVAIAKLHNSEMIDWVMYFLYSPLGQKQLLGNVKAGSHQNLILEDIRKIKIYFPSSKEQTRIATILSDMDAEIDSLEQKLTKARQIKQGMMQQLLTGSIRLINTKTFQPSSLQPETA